MRRFYQYLEETLDVFRVRPKESLYLAVNQRTKRRLEILSREEDSEVRLLVAENTSASATTILRLAEEDDKQFRKTARTHPL